MMLLAFVDTHGDVASLRKLKKKAAKADLILCAGDISIFEKHLKILLHELNSFGKPVLIIPGNHEGDARLRAECSLRKNLFYLHKEFYEQDNILFVGYGGGGFSLRDEKFEKFGGKTLAGHLRPLSRERGSPGQDGQDIGY
jgi:Icc-related predicted phosphoesterase